MMVMMKVLMKILIISAENRKTLTLSSWKERLKNDHNINVISYCNVGIINVRDILIAYKY